MTQQILIVEDELAITTYLRRGLGLEGYTVLSAADGPTALELAAAQPPDLVILDLMLPGMDGLEVARLLRVQSDVPILMLTARNTVADRVAGLEGGADDYLLKPFAFPELLARVRVLLRRRQARAQHEVLTVGPLQIDIAAHSVQLAGRPIELTAKEFDVLELFARHPNQVLTRPVIYGRIWGFDVGEESNLIEVYVRSLRLRLEADGAERLLHTIRGVGYVLRTT